MRALFLADAHLCKPGDLNYRALLTFLDQQSGETDILVLLGDIFEFWIGKATVIEEYVPIIEALERLQRSGTKLVYVEGNHDFHLGPVFTRRLNCQVFPDGGTIQLDGKQIFLAHGDLANPEDNSYLLLRRLLRSSLVRTLLYLLPSRLILSIASRASYQSRKSSTKKRGNWPAPEVLKRYAETILASGRDAIVTGHFHQPFHEKLGDGELIALGDWITQYSYAVYENGVFSLRSYTPSDASPEAAA